MTTAPDISDVAHLRCPSALRDMPAWLCWKYEPGETPTSKLRKVPYYATGGRRHGQQGTREDRAQLTTFDAARAACVRRNFSGVGFCTLPEFNVLALDFDDCIIDGAIHPALLPVLATSYAEFSPSGRGVRAFFRGQLGNHKSHGKPFGIELFSTRGFVTVTGAVLPAVEAVGNGDTIAELDEDTRALILARFRRDPEAASGPASTDQGEPIGLSQAQLGEALAAVDPSCGYSDWLRVGMALHHETRGEGFELWDAWSMQSPKYPHSEKLREHWQSFGRHEGEVVTARSLVKMANDNGAKINLNLPASAEDFEPPADTQNVPHGTLADKPKKFKPIPAHTFAERPPPAWIVKGLIPQAELVVMFGEPGSGKSFLALDLAVAIARGKPWRSRRSRQGRVVYLAAEGAGGFRNRLRAYAQHHQLDLQDLPFEVVPDVPNLLLKDDAIQLARAIGQAALIVVDTFAQVTPGGNENAGEDMGKALAHCKGIHRATGATVLLVHHSGKDASKGARGWSGLRAAADAELEVQRTGPVRVLRVSKQKDGDDSPSFGFDLVTLEIGRDEDDEAITSCVVGDADLPVAAPTRRKLGPVEAVVDAVLQEFLIGGPAPVAEVLKVAAERLPRGLGERDRRAYKVERALENLCAADDGLYALDGTGKLICEK